MTEPTTNIVFETPPTIEIIKELEIKEVGTQELKNISSSDESVHSPSGPKKPVQRYNTIAKNIKEELIGPALYRDVKIGLFTRTLWKIFGHSIEALSKVLIGCSTVLTFASGSFNLPILSFTSGAVNIFSLVLAGFSIYAIRQSRARTEEINMTLRNVGLSNISDGIASAEEEKVKK